MEIIIGIILGIIIGITSPVFINNLLMSKKETEKPQKLSKEDREKQEKLRKNFENLMGYDYNQALKSSKGE